jgi:hypothetical protein
MCWLIRAIFAWRWAVSARVQLVSCAGESRPAGRGAAQGVVAELGLGFRFDWEGMKQSWLKWPVSKEAGVGGGCGDLMEVVAAQD